MELISQLKDGQILKPDGTPYKKIFPLRDPRVVRIIRKIVRGFCFKCCKKVVTDESRVHLQTSNQPANLRAAMENIFEAPGTFSAHGLIADADAQVDSVWLLSFYDNVHVEAVVSREDCDAR